MNKTLKIWLWIVVPAFLINSIIHWTNHPQVVALFKGNAINALYLLVPVMLLAWFIRSLMLHKANPWLDHFSVAFLLGYLAAKGFPKVHTYNEAARSMWILALTSALYLALLLWWDEIGDRLKKNAFLKKIPTGAWLWLFLAGCVALWALMGWEGRYVLSALGLAPLGRHYLARRNPEILKAFGLFLLTDSLIADWPSAQQPSEAWQLVVVILRLLLSLLLFVYWEKLKEPKARQARLALLALVLLPMLLYYSYGYGNWSWPIQVILLGLVWAWDPWLKPYKAETAWALFSLWGLAGISSNGNYPVSGTMTALTVILLTWVTGDARRHYLKLERNLFRLLGFYTLGGVCFAFYPYETEFGISKNAWLGVHLALSGVAGFFWERLRRKNAKVIATTAVVAAIPLGIAFILVIHHWGPFLSQALILACVWAYDVFGLSDKAQDFASKLKVLREMPFFQKTGKLLKKKSEDSGKGLSRFLRQPPVRNTLWAALALAVLGGAGDFLYKTMSAHVTSFTPSGTVTSPNTVIRVRFSDEVMVSGSLDSAFQIEPPLPGSTRLEDANTLVFTPAAPLKPATTYRVHLNTSSLKSRKFFLQGFATTSFSTEPLQVVSCRLFYNYDLITETEKELMGELEFNYPVNFDQLKQHLSVFKEGNQLDFGLEQGTLPTRFFFRAGGLARQDAAQVLKVVLSPDLACIDGGKPLGSKYEKTITLEARPKLVVSEIKLHQVPGNTLISILFTLPVSSAQVRNHVTIEPNIPFKVDTEYCYAVLKADFQPNTDYTVKVHKGITCQSGQVLAEDDEDTLKLEDVHPYVRFADRGRLIPLDGHKIVAVKTMNLDDYSVNVEKVFRNNIVDFLKNSRSYANYSNSNGSEEGDEGEGGGYTQSEWFNTSGLGVQVFNSSVTVSGGQINEEVETSLDFSKWNQASYKGLFVVNLNGANGGGQSSRSFLCTDLGMMMKRSGDDLLVQVLSISNLLPAAAVHLQLISDNNQIIQEKDTDLEGRAWFRNWKNNPYSFQPYVITASKDDDWSYLRTDQDPINQSRFDVGGDPVTSGGWEAFLTSERGLYRPGETAYFTAIVRQANMETPKDLPVNLVVRDSSGNQTDKLTTHLLESGMATFTLPLKDAVTTGRYTAELSLENGVSLATATFKVEEFIPNKIKVEVKPAKKVANAGEQLAFQVRARELFGAPGVNLKVQAKVHLAALEFTHKKWKGYHFSDVSRGFEGENLDVPEGATDAGGLFEAQLPVPDSILPPSMLQAEIYAEVLDSGGRPVGANAVLNVHRYPYYLGLKSDEGKVAAPGKKIHVKYVAVTPDGNETSVKKQTLLLKRKVWYSIFRRSGWSGRGLESESYEQVVDGKEIDIDGKGSYTFTPDKPGEYTLYLGTEQSMRSSIVISVSGPEEQNEENPTNLEQPEKLSLVLDKPQYAVGEIPKLEVRAPFAGRLMLTIEREQVFYAATVPVAAGLNVVNLPAMETGYLPNAYVVGLLVRKPDEAQRHLPMASFGIAPLALDTSSHEISFQWDAPESVKSKQGIDVDLDTGTPGSKVVLAAVDEGILQIIAFTTPDPFKHFYRKRGLTTSTLSLFDDVLPDLERKDAVGGDEGEGFAFRHLNPIAAKRVRSFALFSGILTADKAGKVNYHFPTEKFQGEVRVMVLGVEGNKFGASAFHVKVADPVVVEPSFPRFLAPGDKFDVPVLIYNNTKDKQKIDVALSAEEGPIAVDGEATQSLSLPAEGQQQILFHAKARMDAGVARFKVAATDEAGGTYDNETELAVRPGNPLSTEIKFGSLGSGSTQTLDVPGGFISQGQRVRLAVSSSPLLTFLGSLDYLIRYPYGCAEQKTSESFPLLYFKDIGLLTGRFSDRANAVEEYVQDGINDLCKQQLSDGSFSYWPGQTESGGDYLFYYVSNFLIEAKKKGYDVSDDVMEKIYNKLGAIEVTGKGVGRLDRRAQNVEVPDSAYVLYLKALAGRADVESMAAMKADLKNRSVEQKCLLSLAYSATGDRATALSILPDRYLPSRLQRELDGEWFSPNREMALYLMAMTEADPQNKQISNLLIGFGQKLQDLGWGYFGTTQDDAWCFMAIGKAVKATAQASPLSATWGLKGGEEHALAGETAVVKAEKLSGKTVQLKNTGSQEIYYHLMAEGTKLESKKESVENGISVTREYRDEKGNTVNLGSVAQGQLVVVTLRIKASKSLDNVVIVDLLPAGFEVDNPRLSSRGSLQFDPDSSFAPQSADFRDDRVLLFSGALEGESAFSYSVRAVTPGSFQVPGVTAEAMYDPDIYGRSNKGETLIIAPAKY